VKIKREELLTALKNTIKAVSQKEVLEQSDCFIFSNGKVFGFNDQIAVIHPLPKTAGINGAVRAKELIAFLSKIKDETITLIRKKGDLVIKAAKKAAGFRFELDIQLPLDELEIPDKWRKLPKDFGKIVGVVSRSCARNMDRPAMFCVYANESQIIGSDGEQACRYTFENFSFKKPFLIPLFAAVELSNYNLIKYQTTEGWIFFKDEYGTILCSRSFEAKYPNQNKAFDFKGKKIDFPQDIGSCLERSSIFTSDDIKEQSLIELLLTRTELRVRSENQSGWMREKIKIKYKGPELQFLINPVILQTALGKSSNCLIGDICLKFKSGSFEYLVLTITKK
jgi:DNA polymerase III sliding clamp (beta) subunit (PCNA family)